MEKPKGCGSLAKARTSSAFSRKRANSFSKSLSHGTMLNTHLLASSTLRDQGNGWQLDNIRAASSSCGSCSAMLICFSTRARSEEHTSELQSPDHLVCRLLLEKKKKKRNINDTVTALNIKQHYMLAHFT